MDNRKLFVDLIEKEAHITDNDKILIEAFKTIADYFKPVKAHVEKSNLDKSDYTIITDARGAAVRVSDKNLYFYDKKDYIQLEYYDNTVRKKDYDRLVISGNQVKSTKYDVVLTTELLDKYLELFF